MNTDPSHIKTLWFPLKTKGSNFRTSIPVLKNESLLIIRKSGGNLIIVAITFVCGMALAIAGAITYKEGIDYTGNLIAGSMGSVFALSGLALWFKDKKQVFDKSRGIYQKGKKIIRLDTFVAVQILRKRVRLSSKSSSFWCYETNLVQGFRNRINLLNSGGKYKDILNDAEIIADFLSVPILLDNRMSQDLNKKT